MFNAVKLPPGSPAWRHGSEQGLGTFREPDRGCVVLDQPQRAGSYECCGWSPLRGTQPRSLRFRTNPVHGFNARPQLELEAGHARAFVTFVNTGLLHYISSDGM